MNDLKHKFFNFLLGLGILLSASSCSLHRLDVQTQYLSHENLASYYIGTPDPHLDNPTIGQRLLIQWWLSSRDIENQPLFLHLIVRFRNHQEKEIKIPIETKRGFYIYDLNDQNYCESGGILTYFAEIRNESCIITSWKHPLWANLITFDFSKNDKASDNQE
jgi:hypothetical protein